MKKKITGIRVVFSVCAALGWWGVLYPELTMTPDTYEVVWEEDAVQSEQNVLEWDSGMDVYHMVLEADGSRIHFKSRLLTEMENLVERLK